MPEISPELLQQYSQYFDPSAFTAPSGFGQQSGSGSGGIGLDTLQPGISNPNPMYSATSGLLGNDAASMIDPLGGLLSGLFGGGGDSFKPYVDANGNYVWTSPKKANPVPVAGVPGAKLRPTSTYSDMANQIQALVDLLPYYSKAVSGQIIPQAQANLAAQQATAPGLAQLMTELYRTYGPQLNQVGNDISRQNALFQVDTDAQALQRAQGGLIPEALKAAKMYDPEYYATRELTSNRLSDLMKSINLSGELSGSERAEIERSQAQEGARRGTYNAPSNLDTVSNAMQFGQAGFNRLNTNRSALSDAISKATSALPTFKSGADVFQVATGKPSMPNTGNNLFPGTNDKGVTDAASLAGSLGGGLFQGTNAQWMNNQQINAQKKDWADYLNQVTSSISNLTSSAGSIAGMAGCWIARRVFGESSPKWLMFRDWLFNKAPARMRDYYLEHGEQIAKNLSDEQVSSLRVIMNNILRKAQYVN